MECKRCGSELHLNDTPWGPTALLDSTGSATCPIGCVKHEVADGDGYAVGDILEGSWGYDQTNIDFYRIERRTENTLWLQKLQTRHVSDAGFMSDHVEPGDVVESTPLMRRKLHRDPSGRAIGCAFQPSYGWISRWNGRAALRTSYA